MIRVKPAQHSVSLITLSVTHTSALSITLLEPAGLPRSSVPSLLPMLSPRSRPPHASSRLQHLMPLLCRS